MTRIIAAAITVTGLAAVFGACMVVAAIPSVNAQPAATVTVCMVKI